MEELVQCIPNFSVSHDTQVINQLVETIDRTGSRLVDYSSDTDHNRTVITYVGNVRNASRTAFALAELSIALINVRDHVGVHPRLGSIDVLPFVPIRGVSLGDCSNAATEVGRAIGQRLSLPVFLYEHSSRSRQTLPEIRKLAFQQIVPDFGPSAPHPTAGAVVVGCRDPLIAYNIVINTTELKWSKMIARELRNPSVCGLSGVRALAFPLHSRNLTQVSVNITDTLTVNPLQVLEYVCKRASSNGIDVVESEIIGAIPGYSAFSMIKACLIAPRLKSAQILTENWNL